MSFSVPTVILRYSPILGASNLLTRIPADLSLSKRRLPGTESDFAKMKLALDSVWLIAGREDKIEMSKLDNPEVKKAMKLVDEIMADPKEREIIEARAMAKFNYDSGVAYAKEQGKKERN